MRAKVFFLAVAALCTLRPAGAAEDVAIEAERLGSAVQVRARATIKAPHGLVWRTLTDYNRLPEFVPGLLRSRLIEYRGSAAIVEQSGEARLLAFSYPIDVTVASIETPPDLIEVRLLKGNLRQLDGAYRIESLGGERWVLRWSGIIEPDLPLPPLIGEYLMRANVGDQFLGMVREIERRERERRLEK